MLQVEHLSCGYHGNRVVNDLSFEVKAGQRLCIMGPNGCGKTTLLKAITGLLPYTGSVRIQGKDAKKFSQREVAQNIALMSQVSSIYFSYTVYQTVLLGRYAHSKGGAFSGTTQQDHQIVLDALERTGTLALKDRQITELSGGQLQRVFLARTFAQSPHIILLDEPTNHLDLRYQVELINDLKEWASKEDCCVIGVLHDVNLVLDFADTILLMEQGNMRFLGPTEQLDLNLLNEVYQMDVGGYMRRCLKRWE